MIGSGIGLVVTGREGRVVDSRSFALLRVTKSTETASVLRGSPGLGGKPPRPVTVKRLLATFPPAVQPCVTSVSTGIVGKLIKLRLRSTSG